MKTILYSSSSSSSSSPLFGNVSLIVFSCLWCLILWSGRAWITQTTEMLYMPYNLGLAAIPFLLSSLASRIPHRKRTILLLLLPWLLFFPNAPYLLTDLIHLKTRPSAPLWFDWLFFVSFALTGLLIGLTSLRQVHILLHQYLSPRATWIAVLGILFLTSIGITLGRFLRWNSWDIITTPGTLIADLISLVLSPAPLPKLIAYTGGLTIILSISYIGMRAHDQPCPKHAP